MLSSPDRILFLSAHNAANRLILPQVLLCDNKSQQCSYLSHIACGIVVYITAGSCTTRGFLPSLRSFVSFAIRVLGFYSVPWLFPFHKMHTENQHIAVPHPPQFANWGTFPPGEGIGTVHHSGIFKSGRFSRRNCLNSSKVPLVKALASRMIPFLLPNIST